VAFDAGGIADWLTDRENGRLIGPTLGAAGLGDAIADILANVELRRSFAAGARAVSAKFNLEAHLRALIPVLTRAAEAGPSPA
jgi:glycosyltransferase involved in cell wall biosynthesis